jgi:hypothetical protein
MHETVDQGQRPRAESELRTAGGAEEVGDQRKGRALHPREEQRGTTARDHAPVNLCGLLVRIHRHVDHGEIAVAAESIEKSSKVGERHLRYR